MILHNSESPLLSPTEHTRVYTVLNQRTHFRDLVTMYWYSGLWTLDPELSLILTALDSGQWTADSDGLRGTRGP